MAFSVEIKNLGKLAGEPILVGGLTVLAGPNATGKTFFSKTLYSVFDAMNANPVQAYVQGLVEPMRSAIEDLEPGATDGSAAHAASLNRFTALLDGFESASEPLHGKGADKETARKVHKQLLSLGEEAASCHQELRPFLESAAKDGKHPFFDARSLKAVSRGIADLKGLGDVAANLLVPKGLHRVIQGNLLGNFQVRSVDALQRETGQPSSVDIQGVGRVDFMGSGFGIRISPSGLTRLQRFSQVIYLDSPVYWRLRGALNAAELHRHGSNGLASVDVPKYFYDLDAKLGRTYAGEAAFGETLARLTGQDAMAGKVVLDETGRLGLQEAGRSQVFPLTLAASGSINLGILALLIERRLVDKGTFLFIDEPETNLHPKWQTAMISALLDLAQGGVNVVIATHSSDILERLLALVCQRPEAEQLIALNHFSLAGVINGQQGFREKMGCILRELTDAYSDSYMMTQGLKP